METKGNRGRLLAALAVGLSLASVPLKADGPATAVEPADDYADLSLDALLDQEITVASNRAFSQRETPAIVSIITEEEIRKSGARDLVDLLALVPGFFVATDVTNVVGIGVRGNWAHEGKVLVLLDGHELNELSYSAVPVGGHFLPELIHRIEIIRGPGSAMYGGFAELAVINIVTKVGAEAAGYQANLTGGTTEEHVSRGSVSTQGGWKLSEDTYLGLAAATGWSIRSDRRFHDFYGGSFDMEDDSDIRSSSANFRFRFRDLSAGVYVEQYRMKERDSFDTVLPAALNQYFTSVHGDVTYAWRFGEHFRLLPHFNFKWQEPWNNPTAPVAADFFDKAVARYLTGVRAEGEIGEHVSVMVGGEYHLETSTAQGATLPSEWSPTGERSIEYHKLVGYGEASVVTPVVNLTAGGRIEWHSESGTAGAPRVALTKAFGPGHFKALYSRSFRYPSFENIRYNPSIRPEKTDAVELEAGYRFAENLFFAVNYFDIWLKRPIVYYYDLATASELYVNYPKTGSRGAEAEVRIKGRWGYANAGYSFYSSAGKNRVPVYVVPGEDSVMPAFPRHKLSLYGSVNVTEQFTVNPSLTVMSTRFSFDSVDTAGNSVVKGFRPVAMASIYFRYDGLFVKGLAAGFGIHNIFNENDRYFQAYDGYHAPMPGLSREYALRLEYRR